MSVQYDVDISLLTSRPFFNQNPTLKLNCQKYRLVVLNPLVLLYGVLLYGNQNYSRKVSVEEFIGVATQLTELSYQAIIKAQ